MTEVEKMIIQATKVNADDEIELVKSAETTPNKWQTSSLVTFPPPVEVTEGQSREALFDSALPAGSQKSAKSLYKATIIQQQ